MTASRQSTSLYLHSKAAALRGAAFAALMALCLVVPAYAQAPRDMNSRLTRIENEIDTLSRALFRGEAPPPGALSPGESADDARVRANMELRLSQLEMELRSLTGQFEQQNYRMRQIEEKYSRTIADLEQRVAALESQLSMGAAAQRQGGAMPPRTYRGTVLPERPAPGRNTVGIEPVETEETEITYESAAPSQGVLGTLEIPRDGAAGDSADRPPEQESLSPQESYERAFARLKNREYEAAEKSFQSFLERYPGHRLAENARYWLGETFYVRGNYERAARLFAEGYQKNADGAKGPDNLLKLGMALAGMGKTDDACLTFKQIKRQYGDSAGPIINRARAEAEQIGCSF